MMATLMSGKHCAKFHLTKRLRQIRNARHFWFDLALVFTAQRFGSVVALLTT